MTILGTVLWKEQRDVKKYSRAQLMGIDPKRSSALTLPGVYINRLVVNSSN